MLNKGFIGPVGDDLPSLIPLLFGLLIFFSTFALSFNNFEQKNASYENDIVLMRIARTIQSNSYIYSSEGFQNSCVQVGYSKLNYVAIITEDIVTNKNKTSIYDFSIFSNSENNAFFCTNVEYSKTDLLKDFVSFDDVQGKNVVSRIFPLVVEDEKIVKPMHLVVVAWE